MCNYMYKLVNLIECFLQETGMENHRKSPRSSKTGTKLTPTTSRAETYAGRLRGPATPLRYTRHTKAASNVHHVFALHQRLHAWTIWLGEGNPLLGFLHT